ncbi:helix-turn-helix domain-containing protein [Haladaptatus caseinilyticus]|uniref:helix-turn-helix domain-containing protein n=1 Tax=Haladaptatus caseinilyticus TaxID=2993314 RepID=UPI00224AFB08|nr:helix-turn-helix domain-containing protein [Haladaptatus caseinilyticus]
MPKARVRFRPPGGSLEGPFRLSSEHPNDEFRLLSAYPTDKGLLVVLEATMAEPTIVLDLFEDAPETRVPSYDVLHVDEHTVLLQFQLPFVPAPFRAFFASGTLPQLPYSIEDGWIVCEFTTSHERLSRFGEMLAEAGFAFEVERVIQSVTPTELLTDRQREFMSEALEQGYYDTPRQCSLTDLASALSVSKSTTSVVLHRAEETIVKEFFAVPIDEPESEHRQRSGSDKGT